MKLRFRKRNVCGHPNLNFGQTDIGKSHHYQAHIKEIGSPKLLQSSQRIIRGLTTYKNSQMLLKALRPAILLNGNMGLSTEMGLITVTVDLLWTRMGGSEFVDALMSV